MCLYLALHYNYIKRYQKLIRYFHFCKAGMNILAPKPKRSNKKLYTKLKATLGLALPTSPQVPHLLQKLQARPYELQSVQYVFTSRSDTCTFENM